MAPTSNHVQRKSTLIPSSSKAPKETPQSVKFDVNLCATSRHAGCNGEHHHHSHDHKSPAHAAAHHRRPGSAQDKGESSNHPNRQSKKKTSRSESPTPKREQSDVHDPSEESQTDEPLCFVPSSVKNNNNNIPSSSHSQQCSRSIICCSDVSLIRRMSSTSAPVNLVKGKALKRIFSFLNHSDILHCRAVQKSWNRVISETEGFLDTTVFVVNIQKSYTIPTDTLIYNDVLQWANLPYRHGRFQYIDHIFFKEPHFFTVRNSDNEKYFPSTTFLRSLTTIEFRFSYLLWSTLKNILTKAILLDELIIHNCYISESTFTNTSNRNEFDDFTAGNTIFGLKRLEVYETRYLGNITKLLKKLTGYSNQSLTSLKIRFYPPANMTDDGKSEWFDFCRELKALLSLCANSLEVLVLDIQHEPTLDLLGYHLSKELEALGYILDLKEFQLSPSLGVWLHPPDRIPKQNVAMTLTNVGTDAQKSVKNTAASLARFLESQTNLRTLGLPCIEYPEAYSSCFKSVLKRLPCAAILEELAVPCAGFLPEDFLYQFPSLKKLKVGASCCGDITSSWDIFWPYTGEQISSSYVSPTSVQQGEFNQSLTPITQEKNSDISLELLKKMKNIKELCISSVEFPEAFNVLVKNLCNLTSLEINSGPDTPVFSDNDLQACVKYLKNLETLMIGCSEKLTDYGITGIPLKYCQLMFKSQKYHADGVNPNIWTSETVHGSPLSDLKGLRKLVLVGRCSFTDIGIGYGLSFQELKYCHLPYSDNITSWGIERFGSMNPSLESFVLSGVNQLMKDSFLKLRRTHERLKNGDASRSGYYSEQTSPFEDNVLLMLPTPQEAVATIGAYFLEKMRRFFPMFRHSHQIPRNELNAAIEEAF